MHAHAAAPLPRSSNCAHGLPRWSGRLGGRLAGAPATTPAARAARAEAGETRDEAPGAESIELEFILDAAIARRMARRASQCLQIYSIGKALITLLVDSVGRSVPPPLDPPGA